MCPNSFHLAAQNLYFLIISIYILELVFLYMLYLLIIFMSRVPQENFLWGINKVLMLVMMYPPV